MIQRIAPLLVLPLLIASATPQDSVSSPDITAADLLAHVKRLASDAWEGRGSGSPGEQKATAYIAAHFRRLGLRPAGEASGYFQPVPMSAGFDLGKGCRFEIMAADRPVALVLDKDYRPFGASANGKVEGDAVFAGYGVSAPDLDYDDYAGLDVAGKIVFVFRHLPRKGGALGGAGARRNHATFVAKLAQAAKRGAIALVVVNDPWNFPSADEAAARGIRRPRPDVLQRGGVGRAPGPSLPFVHLTLAAARRLFPGLFAATPEKLEEAIQKSGSPVPRPGRQRLRLAVELVRKTLIGRNVLGLLEAGAKDATDEIIVVGGHHDHLGRGMAGSLERDPKLRRTIHNGADDNASGTSGVMEVAEFMAARRQHLRRSILFMTFTGEERGLLGSRYFVDHPTLALERIVAMLNMDMIGRLEGRKLFLGGVKTSPVWMPLIRRVNETLALPLVPGPGGRAPSDNTSFYMKQKPVLFFFSGMHPDYHRPSDDWPKIDTAGMERIARLVGGIVDELARGSAPVPFTRADSGGFGPPRAVIGISIGPAQKGVAVAGLAPQGPAEKAGMKIGDVIVELAGEPIKDFGALRAAMRKQTIGEKITVRVLRGGKPLAFEITLGRG